MLQLSLLTLFLRTQLLFGGEKPLGPAPDPDNWHHEGLARSGTYGWWSAQASNALAFHTDYVDSYQYNPLWWGDIFNDGGLARLEIVVSQMSELSKLHFDDLFNSHEVMEMWRRYLSGTVCGLIWCAHSGHAPRVKVSCAHNVVGASLHALQDFYSHSNWIDEGTRRNTTWFEADDAMRQATPLYTGSYELPTHLGVHPHGTYEPQCALIEEVPGLSMLLNAACYAASPLRKSSICNTYRRCATSVAFSMPIAEGVTLPKGVVYTDPGMNVDSRWYAPIGVQTRGSAMNPSIDANSAFETAYLLAARTTCQWLKALEEIMQELNLGNFWEDVKSLGVTRSNYKTDIAPFEQLDLIPYEFLTAGEYPPAESDDVKWYVRLTIRTSDKHEAGTDADIIPIIDDTEYGALDHSMKPAGGAMAAILSYNDFATDSVASYMVGPLDYPPNEIVLKNNARDLGTVFTDIFDQIVTFVKDVGLGVGDFFLGLVGFHADFVAASQIEVWPDDLAAIRPGTPLKRFIDCDGDSEGHYRVHVEIHATGVAGAPVGKNVPTMRYLVAFTELECVEESDVDSLATVHDEPFVVGLVLGHGAKADIPWRTQPYRNVDTGERRTIHKNFDIEVPERYGFISLPIAVWEHDSETAEHRDDIMNDFANDMRNRYAPEEDGVLNILGEKFGEDWHCDRIDVFAFRRAEEAEVVEYEQHVVNQWVDGQKKYAFKPHETHRHRVEVRDYGASGDCESFPYAVPRAPKPEKWDNPDDDPNGTPYHPEDVD